MAVGPLDHWTTDNGRGVEPQLGTSRRVAFLLLANCREKGNAFIWKHWLGTPAIILN